VASSLNCTYSRKWSSELIKSHWKLSPTPHAVNTTDPPTQDTTSAYEIQPSQQISTHTHSPSLCNTCNSLDLHCDLQRSSQSGIVKSECRQTDNFIYDTFNHQH
jgi:hypothetical protein